MNEEMEQLNERFDRFETRFNERFDKLEEMIIQVTEMALATNQRLDKYVGDSNPEQRLQKAESDIKLIKEQLLRTTRRVNDLDNDLTDLKYR